MRRLSVLVAVVLAAGLVSLPVAAHTNDLAVDSQVSADGGVVVERAVVIVDGYLVVHRDDGGQPGEPIGHVPFTAAAGYRFDFPVPVDDGAWADWNGSRRVWVAFHREASGEGFDPADDPIQEGFSGPVAQRLTLARGDEPVRILNDRYDDYRLTTDRVTVREVASARGGRVVVRAVTENGTNPVAGSRTVPAGVQRNVTVPLNDSVFATHGRDLRLTATLATDGEPVTVGGTPVRTGFEVERVGQLNLSDGSPTTATATSVPATTEPAVVTPSPTPTGTETPTETATRTPTTGTGGPGFGVVLALAAVSLAAVLARRA